MRDWRRQRNQAGQSLAEGAAVMALMLPLFIVIIFVGGEVVQAYLTKNVLTQAASKAARDMSIDYWQDKSIATSRLLTEFSGLRSHSYHWRCRRFSAI
jgi:hypothetical protein